jgi:leader peptidase (prepilin peptidase)/N-methyltransferase
MVYISVWLALFGLCVGSFLNVIIYRLPKKIFFGKSRSCCPACGEQLKPRDLIPVLSYIFLKGRCRWCGMDISPRYPIVEAFCSILAVLCFLRFGVDDWLKALITFGAAVILTAVFVIDFETMEIPDALIISLIPFAAGAVWAWTDVAVWERAVGFFIISLPMFILAFLITDAFGGGDIKLMAVCGFMLGWKNTLLAFFVGLTLGGGYAIYLLLSRKSKRGALIAFGPYLCTGICLAMFYGAEIIEAYLDFFMFMW